MARVYYIYTEYTLTEYLLSEFSPPLGGEKSKRGDFFIMIFDISERSKKTMNNETGSQEWVRLPMRCLQDKDLTLSDVIVLAAIIDYIDTESKAMSIDKIAKKTSLSERQIKRSVKNLIENKYITAETEQGKKTVYTQCGVLPPKRQSQKKPQPYKPKGADYYNRPKSEKEKKLDELRIKKYEAFINFEILEPEEQEERLREIDRLDEEMRRLQA